MGRQKKGARRLPFLFGVSVSVLLQALFFLRSGPAPIGSCCRIGFPHYRDALVDFFHGLWEA
jgi:hypothetical protein